MALDDILADVEATLEWAVEIDSVSRADGTAKTWYYSTHPRETTGAETPASTTFEPFLKGPVGPLAQTLAEDRDFSGAASSEAGSLALVQRGADSDRLSPLLDYTFAGREVRLKVGRRSDAYASFETYRTLTCDREPEVAAANDGLRATFVLSSVTGRLEVEPLNVNRYVGIPHCIEGLTTTFVATASYNAAYVLPTFTLGLRFKASANPAAIRNLFTRASGAGQVNFALQLLTTGKLRLNYTHSAGTSVNIDPTMDAITDGEWHTIVWGWLDATSTYVLVDNEAVYSVAVTHSLDTHTGSGPIWLGRFIVGKSQDYRLYNRYLSPDEARGVFSVRSDGDDLGCVGLWRMDDNGGSSANDYSATANDAALTGVLNTDYSWAASDLGEPELAGRPMPMLRGEVLNAPAHLIDTNRQRYRGNDGSGGWESSGSNTTLTVRSQGTVLTGGGTDYTAPSNGGGGVFQMTGAEAEPVTFSLVNDGSSTETFFVPEVASLVLSGRTRLGTPDHVEAMTLLAPWKAGFWTDADATAAQAIQELLGGSSLCCYESAAGDLTLDMLIPPMGYSPYGEPVLDFRDEDGATFTGATASPTGDFSICGWFKTPLGDQTTYNWGSSEPNIGSIYLCQVGNVSVYYQAVGSGAGKIKVDIGGTTVATAAGHIRPSVWHFIGVDLEDATNTVRVYVGEETDDLLTSPTIQKVLDTTLATSPTSGTTYQVGHASAGSRAWCSVHHVQVWNSRQSLSGFAALMADPDTALAFPATCLFYAPMNEGEGAPVEAMADVTATLGTRTQWAPKFTVNLGDTPSVRWVEGPRRVAPAAEVAVYYARNRRPLGDAEIDTGVSQSDRLDLRREWKDVWLPNADNRTRYRSSRKIVLQSPITDRAAAQRLARSLMVRFGTDRWVGQLSLPPGLAVSRRACGLRLLDEVGVVSPVPTQLDAGRSFRVVGAAPTPPTLSTRLNLWG